MGGGGTMESGGGSSQMISVGEDIGRWIAVRRSGCKNRESGTCGQGTKKEREESIATSA